MDPTPDPRQRALTVESLRRVAQPLVAELCEQMYGEGLPDAPLLGWYVLFPHDDVPTPEVFAAARLYAGEPGADLDALVAAQLAPSEARSGEPLVEVVDSGGPAARIQQRFAVPDAHGGADGVTESLSYVWRIADGATALVLGTTFDDPAVADRWRGELDDLAAAQDWRGGVDALAAAEDRAWPPDDLTGVMTPGPGDPATTGPAGADGPPQRGRRRGGMRRLRRSVTVPLGASSIPAAVERIRRNKEEIARTHRLLRVRVKDDGRLRARIVSAGRYASPPYFRGGIRASGGATLLEGTVRESRLSVLWPRLYALLTVFMGLVSIGLLAAGELTSPGVAICAIAAVAFGALAYAMGRQRRDSFEHEASELELLLGRCLRSGPART